MSKTNNSARQSGFVFIIVFIVLVLASAIVFTFRRVSTIKKARQSINSAQGDTSNSEPVTNPLLEETWVEKTNERLGYTYSHPQSWDPQIGDYLDTPPEGKIPVLYETLHGGGVDEVEEIHIKAVRSENENRTLEFLLSGELKEITNQKEITVNGIRAAQYYWQSEVAPESLLFPDPHIATELDHDGYRYAIYYTYPYGTSPNKLLEVYNRVVSSFRFTQ